MVKLESELAGQTNAEQFSSSVTFKSSIIGVQELRVADW